MAMLKGELSAPASDDIGFYSGIDDGVKTAAENTRGNIPAAAPYVELKSLPEKEDSYRRQLLDAARKEREEAIERQRLEIIKSEEMEHARRKKNELEREAELERRRAERENSIENQRRERENDRHKRGVGVSRILPGVPESPDANQNKEKTEISERERIEQERQRELDAMRAERNAAIERQRLERENARRIWRESREPIEPSEEKSEITSHVTPPANDLPASLPEKNDARPDIETPAVASSDNIVKPDALINVTNQADTAKGNAIQPQSPDTNSNKEKTEISVREKSEQERQRELDAMRAERNAAIERQRLERENARRIWRELREPIKPSEEKSEITSHVTLPANDLPSSLPEKNDVRPDIETPAVASSDNIVKRDALINVTNQADTAKGNAVKPQSPDTNSNKEKTEISEREKPEKERQKELEAMRAERSAAIEKQRLERENARRNQRESRELVEPSEEKSEITSHVTLPVNDLPAPPPEKNDARPDIETPVVASSDNVVKPDSFINVTNQAASQKEDSAKSQSPDINPHKKTENASREEIERDRQTEIERKRAEREAAIEKQRQERENAERTKQEPDDNDEYE
ncbi:MAG: hypothetical protein LBS53_05995 [Synergistaceae bacterium]|nr:hypothetical protein [Synergistaceae bacterium]